MSDDAILGIIVLIYISVPAIIYGGEFIWWIFFSKPEDKRLSTTSSIGCPSDEDCMALAIWLWPLTLVAGIIFCLIYIPFEVIYDKCVKYRERRINAIKISRHSQE